MYASSYVLAKILLTLSARFTEEAVVAWFENAEIIKCTEDTVILYSPSPDNLKILNEQCYSYIHETVKELLQCNATLEIWGSQKLENYKHNQIAENNSFNPQLVFSNYIVGKSNEMAVKVAKAVTSSAGAGIYNPLYMYGPSGVGKTHLLCAIANEMLRVNPKVKICYAVADTFVGELIWGLRNGAYDAFRTKYQSVDVLIIDDIQFLAGKAATQEEFYSIIDFLYQNNKQLIVSANNCPSLVPGLESFLYSKFEQGVVIGIDTPDITIRRTVVAQLNDAYNLGISDETIEYVAESIPNSIRKTIGVMKKLRASHDLDGVKLTLGQTRIIVDQLL